MASRARPLVELHAGGSCALACVVCDCHSRPSTLAWGERTLRDGCSRVTLRGDLLTSPDAKRWLDLARRAGGDVVVRTHAQGLRAEQARALREAGVTAVRVPIFSQHPRVHDRLAGADGSLTRTLLGLRVLDSEGLRVDVETPLLEGRLQSLGAVFELVRRAASTARQAQVFLPRWPVPTPVAPPPWSTGRTLLREGLEKALELGFEVDLGPSEAVPLCAIVDAPRIQARVRPAAGPSDRAPGTTLLAPCTDCAAADRCAGVAASYEKAHGAKDLLPLSSRPRGLGRRQVRAEWTRERRQAARATRLLVLRPTVHCNQDCTFCSANESTPVWSRREEMLREIARAARRGVRTLSFSGGEPTLSPHLPAFVRAARRLGLDRIELVTNGVLLASERRAKALVDAGLTHAFVSLHAHDEALSRQLTCKEGDHEKTLEAIRVLLSLGVDVSVNHVVNARNHPFLERFVEFMHERFDGRVPVSFAFVTPQFKALENIELVPRFSDVRPNLRRALRRALALGQPFILGSRQGLPPCQLGEFRAWSDIFHYAPEAFTEDAPQKRKAPACASCRYDPYCTGVWAPYASRYGMDELVPVPGEPFTEDEVARLRAGRPLSFEDVPDELRDRAAESEALDPALPSSLRLPVLTTSSSSRPLRLALFGTGGQARRVARAVRNVERVTLAAVGSSHATEAQSAFDFAPVFTDAVELLDAVCPDAVIVAAATRVHVPLATLALERGLPVLLACPLAPSEEDAKALLGQPGLLMPAVELLFSSGLLPWLADAPPRLRFTRTFSPRLAPAAWSVTGLSRLLLDPTSLAAHLGTTAVQDVIHRGDSRPEWLHVSLASQDRTLELRFDFAASKDALFVEGEGARWAQSADSSGLERLIAHFRDVVLGREPPRVAPEQALLAMQLGRRIIEAADAAGVPLERPNRPRHVASRSLREAGS